MAQNGNSKSQANRQVLKKLQKNAEKLDKTPVTLSGPRAPLSLKERIQRQVRTALSQIAEEKGMETFEEANDFEEEDPDPDWFSPHELRNQVVDQNLEHLDGTPDPQNVEGEAAEPNAAGSPDEPSPT